MITILYDENNGIPVADGAIDYWVNLVVKYKDEDRLFETSTGLCIDAIRVAIKEKRLDHTLIQFKYKEDILSPNKDGRLPRWPDSFNDKITKYLSKL